MFRKISFLTIAMAVAVTASDWSNSTSAQDAKPKAKGRLPAYYSKVDVDDKQRDSIYKIQADYDVKIDKLQAELDALKAKRDGELRDVLTKAQQKLLDEALAEAKSKTKSKIEDKVEKKMEK